MIKVIADQNLYRLKEFLPEDVELITFDPNEGLPDISGFDALLLRTVSKLNSRTLPEIPSSLTFVGTGSSGSDHVDKEYLKRNDIKFADALGNNARAVAEYIMTSLLIWREKKQKDLHDYTYGIVGVGKAGSAVSEIFQTFGLRTVLYDPPRAKKDPDFKSSSLEDVLKCDVLTFHTPLNKEGNYPTYHWLDKKKLAGKSYELIINAARGGILDEKVVSDAIESGNVKSTIIDVWDNEPDFDCNFAKQAFIATPHIAGFSEQSKLIASKMICSKLCAFFKLNCPSTSDFFTYKELEFFTLDHSFLQFMLSINPIMEYDAALRDLALLPDKGNQFRTLRTDRPFRYEYGFLKLEKEFLNGFDDLKKLGVRTI